MPPTTLPASPAPAPEVIPQAAAPTALPAVVELPPPPAAPAPAPSDDPNGGIVTFKPGKGVDIKSNDGNFALNVSLKSQLLDEAHKRKDAKKLSNDFFVRRARLAFSGNVFSKNVKYKAEVTFAASELGRVQPKTIEKVANSGADAATLDRDYIGQSPLMDLYFDFTHVRDLNIRVGQSKVPFGRERMWSDNTMIVVDRSLEDTEYNFDRDMGIDFRSGDFLGLNLLHYYLGVYMGEDKNASLSTIGRGDLGLLYNARIELLPFGNFEEIATDFDRDAPKLSIGVGYAFLQTDATSTYSRQSLGTSIGKYTDVAKIDYNVHNFTADALFKAGGLTLLTAFHYRKVVDLPSSVTVAKNGLGWVGQIGYLFSNEVPFEIQVNYGLIRAVKKATSNTVPNNEFGGGINYYFNKHYIKLQAEVARIWYENEANKNANDTRVRVLLQVLL